MNDLETIFQKLNSEQTGAVEVVNNNNDMPNISEENDDLDAILNCTNNDDDDEGLMSLLDTAKNSIMIIVYLSKKRKYL